MGSVFIKSVLGTLTLQFLKGTLSGQLATKPFKNDEKCFFILSI